jgi:hypothetical protein
MRRRVHENMASVLVFRFLFATVVLGLTPGCATLFGGLTQTVTVETREEGAVLLGSNCDLKNTKGAWSVTTPGSVVINRSFSDLAVSCTHANHRPASLVVKSATGPLMLGNIIMIGGLIGAAIDIDNGAAFDYPLFITVDLGPARVNP